MKKRSKLSLSNYHLSSMKMGYLVPVNCTEVLPGDTIQQSTGVFMRLAPMVAPVMHPVHMSIYHFYVPTRILWDDFENFITGGPDGADTTVPPQLSDITPVAGSLCDYLGLPLSGPLTISALPLRAYGRIWNEFFRDQDLQEETSIGKETSSGVVTARSSYKSGLSVRRCSWAKDYFTTARPWPQKGPGITIPVDTPGTGELGIKITGNGAPTFSIPSYPVPTATSFSTSGVLGYTSVDEFNATNWKNPALKATVTGGSPGGLGSIDVSSLRQAMAMQRFEEKRALFGSKYEDYLRLIGVRPQDSRLKNPEYLGGSSQTIQFSEVLQTGGDNVGALYGHGIAAMKTNRYRRFIPEHGFIMSLMLVRPIPVYTQGVDRMWTRQTKEDYWQKELQHIGQQEVLNREVYADGTDADNGVFGYQNRYDEYRRGVNKVSGEFRTNQDYWHMARIFESRPALNSSFVTCTPTDRIFQANEQNSDQLYCMIQNNILARRLVDKNGNPI